MINVTTRDGHRRAITGHAGRSLMENLRGGGIEEVLALCGGCLSCGTCLIYVADAWLAALPPMGRDEDAMLAFSDERKANSRLSCQIRFDAALDGIEVTVAPED